MFKKAAQRGRSERRGVDPLHVDPLQQQQWVPRQRVPVAGLVAHPEYDESEMQWVKETKLEAFFNILLGLLRQLRG